MSESSFDLGFFPPEINYWYDTSETLWDHWTDLVHIPRLPELNDKLDPRITALVPALNEAKTNLCLNISAGSQATFKFAESLLDAAQHYGMTAEGAEELAREWNDR